MNAEEPTQESSRPWVSRAVVVPCATLASYTSSYQARVAQLPSAVVGFCRGSFGQNATTQTYTTVSYSEKEHTPHVQTFFSSFFFSFSIAFLLSCSVRPSFLIHIHTLMYHQAR